MESRRKHPAALSPKVILAIQALLPATGRAQGSRVAGSSATDRTPAPRQPRRSNMTNPSDMASDMVSVRYMVDDVEKAVAFYTTFLDFEVLNKFPAFAD